MRLNKLNIFFCASLYLVFATPLKAQIQNEYLFPINPGSQNFLAGTLGELRTSHFHAGIDVRTGGVTGLPVYASADGYVSRLKVSGTGYGYVLYVEHPKPGTSTVYAHLDAFNETIARWVRNEQYRAKKFEMEFFPTADIFPVKKGDIIGYAGNTGSSSGPHLHYELRDSRSRPIDPLRLGFNEIKDNISPIVQMMALKTLDKESRIYGQFGLFEFNPARSGSSYKVAQTIPVYGRIGIMFMGYDQLNGSANRTGIPQIELYCDGKKLMRIDIHAIPFNENRQILVYRDHSMKDMANKSYQKLYIDKGNTLDIFYDYDEHKGELHILDTLTHNIEIRLQDVHGNQSFINFSVKGQIPESNIVRAQHPFRYAEQKVDGHTLVLMQRGELTDTAMVYLKRRRFPMAPDFRVENTLTYLWDLRRGIPDSIKTSSKTIIPQASIMIPSGRQFRYYHSRIELSFQKESLFDSAYIEVGSFFHKKTTSDSLEYFMIGESSIPLFRNFSATVNPSVMPPNKRKTSVYSTNNFTRFSYRGGQWDNNKITFRSTEFGKFVLLTDTIPPEIRVANINRNFLAFYISDRLSGIKDYDLYVDGEWVLMNHDPKRNYIYSEKIDDNKPFKGKLELKVRDMVDNEKIYVTQIP
ncbi:MAG: M23 family metallopeptidase [Cyclobacteriaceae bacterium]|nr:M23 family metallopeptidase [Cyclobacteriaceae bacterium]